VIADLTRQADAQRVLAIAEEIDEVIAGYDAALKPLVAMVEELDASVAVAAALAERAAALAAGLPASAQASHGSCRGHRAGRDARAPGGHAKRRSRGRTSPPPCPPPEHNLGAIRFVIKRVM
jgi:hypothetical protein